jgi:hypothetical protein
MTEYTRLATGKDPLGTYQLRVLRGATELEMSGAIIFGLTDDIRQTLDVYPTIRVIQLNSQGGRVAEARKLRDLIALRGLTTDTAAGCFSACTLVHAAGRERLIAKSASLGFHQYSFPRMQGSDFQYEKDKEDWLARGFTRAFVEKAFTTPNNTLWRPAHHELFEAHVVTGYSDSHDVSGFCDTWMSRLPMTAVICRATVLPLRPMGQTTPALQTDSPLSVVQAYYVDLNRQDINAARSKWETPPSRLQDMVQQTEWFRLENIQLVEVAASTAHVAVVVTSKRRDQPPEGWRGTITLEKRAGVWKIVTMPLTRQ